MPPAVVKQRCFVTAVFDLVARASARRLKRERNGLESQPKARGSPDFFRRIYLPSTVLDFPIDAPPVRSLWSPVLPFLSERPPLPGVFRQQGAWHVDTPSADDDGRRHLLRVFVDGRATALTAAA